MERVLGTGGFGITYLARDTSLGRKVVIKENLPSAFAFRDTASGTVRSRSDLTEDEDNFRWSMKNFLREADTLASLDHPGIVSVLRKFEANGTAYFVMPFMEGLPLDELMKNRRDRGEEISDDELRGLLEHVLDVLGYLHGKSIYHRDIKPGNILVTKEGVPILIDFGSARQRLSERSMTVVESAGYTPFEQLQSRGNVGPWSDLYSLGATVSKAITGEAPPKAADRILDDPWVALAKRGKLRERYSGELLESIDRALDPQVSPRFQDAGEWLGALDIGGWEEEDLEVADPPEAPAVGQLEEDDAELQFRLGKMHATGSGKAKDEADAVKWYRKAAEQGHAGAQCDLGLMYANGRGVGKNEAEAVKWYRKAAEQREANAQFNLGLRYSNGRGVAKDEAEAAEWYRKAAEQGDADAQCNLGVMYANGLGVAKDEAEAVKWYRKAVEQGDADAQFNLGMMYASGRGVAKDKVEAVKWYRKAAACRREG